jgi:pyridoxal phosphate enzyme (YggS family)
VADAAASRILDNLEAVRARMARAAARAGRPAGSVRLIAVSKTFPADDVAAAAAAGQHDFGENRIQEALPKIEATRALDVRWHLVGHLQSNKARKAVGPFAFIHSIDSLDLLERLDRVAVESGQAVDVLIEVDLAGEATKFGLAVDDATRLFERATHLAGARVAGLMVMPPYFDDPEQARPYFRRLRELREALAHGGIPPAMLRELSMGMSHDFEIAIEEGSTMVRVGTAIFGARPPAHQF